MDAALTLGELIARTDAGLLLVHDAGPVDVASVVLREPGARQRIAAGAVVLAVGYGRGDPAFEETVAAAGEAHAAAVIAKPSTADHETLRESGERHAVGTVLADQSTDWLALASMLRSAAAISTLDVVAGIGVGDLFAFANAVALAAGGATAIVDPAGRLLSFSNIASQPLDELRRRTTLLMAEEDSPAVDPDYQRVYAAPGCVYVPGAGDTMARMAVAVRSDREILGSLWTLVPPGTDPAVVEAALLELVDSAAVHLHNARAEVDVQRYRHAQLLQSVLGGDESGASSALALGIESRGWFRLVQLAPRPAAAPMTRQQVRSISNWLHIVHETALFTEVNGQMVVLFTGSHADEWPGIEQSLSHFLRTSDAVRDYVSATTSHSVARAGELSREFQRLRTLTSLTEITATSGAAEPLTRMEAHWAEVELATIAQAYAGNDAGRSAPLDRLREQDRAQQGETWATLCAYVRCNRSYADAALRLNVHVNTVRYRIDRLRESFGLDVNDPATFGWLTIQVHAPER